LRVVHVHASLQEKEPSAVTIEEFLASNRTDLPAIQAEADRVLGLKADEALLAVGSLVEGLGSRKSDLDLFWITPRSAAELPPEMSITLVVNRCLVDVRVLRVVEIENLLDRFAAWCSQPWNTMREAKFPIDDRVLLHRLLSGLLLNEKQKAAMEGWRPARDDLARLKLHMARHASRTIQVDMVGYRDHGDFHSLVFAAQEGLGHTIDALLAGYGYTNPQPRWRSRILRRIPKRWEQALPLRPSGLPPAELYWRLHRAPKLADEKLAVEHAARIVSFSRGVFKWAEGILLRQDERGPRATNWSRVERVARGRRLPYLDLDVDFASVDGGVVMGRLNEFGESVALSPREFAAALLFDGTTTVREAEMAIQQGRSGNGASALVKNLIARLDAAKFILRPAVDLNG
jgi:HEPN domain-containing protein